MGELFSRRLRRLRIRAKLTQGDLAQACGCTSRAISHWECGKWPGWRVVAICNQLAPLLGVTPHYLRFGWEEHDIRLAALERAAWSFPNEELIEECRSARREIEAAEGFVRPRV